MRGIVIAVVVFAMIGGGAFADDSKHAHKSTYASIQSRQIKALSDEQIADLREGRGMGASLPAELNGVPGPLHVLELAQQLNVTVEQRSALQRVMVDMKALAQKLGTEVIAAEAELDTAFKSGEANEVGIKEMTARIAALQAQLRAVHLTAHLKTKGLLTSDQVAAYNVARGYSEPSTRHRQHR